MHLPDVVILNELGKYILFDCHDAEIDVQCVPIFTLHLLQLLPIDMLDIIFRIQYIVAVQACQI